MWLHTASSMPKPNNNKGSPCNQGSKDSLQLPCMSGINQVQHNQGHHNSQEAYILQYPVRPAEPRTIQMPATEQHSLHGEPIN